MSLLVTKHRSLLVGAAAAAVAAVSGVALAALGLGVLLHSSSPTPTPPMVTASQLTAHPARKTKPVEPRPVESKPAELAPTAPKVRPQRRVASPTPASEPCEGGWRELMTGPAGRRVYVDCPGGPLTRANKLLAPTSTGLSRLAVPGTDHAPLVELGVDETFAHGTNELRP